MNLRLSYTEQQQDVFFPKVPSRHTIIPKGRRFGATRGASHACIEWAIEGMPILWGDTVYGNITKYVERYFQPALKANEIPYDWKVQERVLKIGNGYIDFRSADNPANWEGFGYRKIILNEAGIILGDKDGNSGPYLYTNAVRPMMTDFPDAELYALGVPKGKRLRTGKAHPFSMLWDMVGTDGYRGQRYSSYDNPYLRSEDVDELKADMARMDPEQIRQEIYGEFIEMSAGRPFAFAFNHAKHVRPAAKRPKDTHYASIDFNVEPFCATIYHLWQDSQGWHVSVPYEIKINTATINEMGDRLMAICPHRHLWRITGDRGGTARRIGATDNTSMFEALRQRMGISPAQLTIPPNPTHLKSREDTNLVLNCFPDFAIDPSCDGLITDLTTVEVDGEGHIIKADRSKANQQSDILDTLRYFVNTYLSPWCKQYRIHEPLRKPSTDQRSELLHR